MTTLLASTRAFAHRHDELPAFHAAYLVIAVLSAALFSLGLFATLIALHMALDYVKYREVHHCTLARTLQGMTRESMRDVMLLSVGLVCAVYLHHTMGMAALSGLVRSEAVILQALGTVLPKYFILNESLLVAVHLRSYLSHQHPRMGKGWNAMEITQMLIIAASAVLLAAAAPLMHMSQAHVGGILLHELTVWM
jgi:hypothetical protein